MRALSWICFDFDGTLVQSMDVAFKAFVQAGPEFGCRPFTRDELMALRGLHVREVIREVGVPLYQVPRLAGRVRRIMRDELMETPPVEGIAEVLSELRGRGYRLGVLSSNAESSVLQYMRLHRLDVFELVIGDTGLFSKARALRRLLRGQEIAPDALVYVGDEVRDIEAARRAGVRCAAVGWGYNAPDRLAVAGPDYLVASPRDLLGCLP